MHFLVYLPGAGPDPERLADAGLAELIADALAVPLPRGPDGASGALFGWRTRSGALALAHDPAGQDWIPAVAAPDEGLPAARYWIGWSRSAPPGPADLARPYPYAGQRVLLGDGHEWLIPALEKLPADMLLADDGSWRYVTQRRFHDFTLAGQAWQERLKTPDTAWFYWSEAANFLLAALKLNYRLTGELVSRLRLFQSGEGSGLHRALLAVLRPELLAPHRPHLGPEA